MRSVETAVPVPLIFLGSRYVLAIETLQGFDDAFKQFAFVVELGGHFSSFDKSSDLTVFCLYWVWCTYYCLVLNELIFALAYLAYLAIYTNQFLSNRTVVLFSSHI